VPQGGAPISSVELKKLDDLGIANNTVVIYTTDNGAETFTWPDGGTTPFRSEKNTNWEGGYRVPALVRWPGLVQPHSEVSDIVSAEDWVQTLMGAAGEPDIKDKLLQGYAGGKNFKVHLDGYDQRDVLAGKDPDKRREFFYWTDDGNLAGLRYDQYKAVFMEQQAHGLEAPRRRLSRRGIRRLEGLAPRAGHADRQRCDGARRFRRRQIRAFRGHDHLLS
jgi:arylsulfatase